MGYALPECIGLVSGTAGTLKRVSWVCVQEPPCGFYILIDYLHPTPTPFSRFFLSISLLFLYFFPLAN